MSTISTSQRPGKCSWHRRRKSAMARADFGVQPETYSRSSIFSARAFRKVRSNLSRRSDDCGFEVMGCDRSVERAHVKTNQNAFSVRQVADDLLHGLGEFPHQRGDRQNLITLRELRILQQIHHLNPVGARKMRLAQSLEVGERRQTLRRLARDIEAQLPDLRRGLSSLQASQGTALPHRRL